MAPEPRSVDADDAERWATLDQLERWIEVPMMVLSFGWLALVLAELVWGGSRLFDVFGTVIWLVFIADFGLRFVIAPNKAVFLRNNVITIVALALPAFRMVRAFRVLRAVRAARGLRLVRIVGTANRSMNALRRSLDRRGLGYVLLTTIVVIALGAAGMLTFEPAGEIEGGFESYGDALWWTAMLVSTMGSAFWPITPEGRVLTLLLSVYGLAVFGYITASFATFFIGQEAREGDDGPLPAPDIAALREQITLLRSDLSRRGEPR